MTTMISQECKCALCGALNQCDMLASTNTFGGLDTEFRTHAAGYDPLPLYVHTCITCGYSAYDIEENLLSDDVAGIKEIVDSFFSEEQQFDKEKMPPYKQYELVAQIMNVKHAAGNSIAETYLRAAWVADDYEQGSLAKRYRKNAASLLAQILATEKDGSVKAEKMFRLAEIYRRSGEFELASKTREKISKDKSHPDLLLASSKLQDLVLQNKDGKVMFAEIL